MSKKIPRIEVDRIVEPRKKSYDRVVSNFGFSLTCLVDDLGQK